MLKKLFKDEHYFVGFYDTDGIYETPHIFRDEAAAMAHYNELIKEAPQYKWTIFKDGHRTSKGEWLKPQEAWK